MCDDEEEDEVECCPDLALGLPDGHKDGASELSPEMQHELGKAPFRIDQPDASWGSVSLNGALSELATRQTDRQTDRH